MSRSALDVAFLKNLLEKAERMLEECKQSGDLSEDHSAKLEELTAKVERTKERLRHLDITFFNSATGIESLIVNETEPPQLKEYSERLQQMSTLHQEFIMEQQKTGKLLDLAIRRLNYLDTTLPSSMRNEPES